MKRNYLQSLFLCDLILYHTHLFHFFIPPFFLFFSLFSSMYQSCEVTVLLNFICNRKSCIFRKRETNLSYLYLPKQTQYNFHEETLIKSVEVQHSIKTLFNILFLFIL